MSKFATRNSQLATRNSQPATRNSQLAALLAACGLWLAACSLSSCARPHPAPAPAAWRPSEFLIALRGAPPPKPQHYAQAAQAGFNALAEPVGYDALDLARRYGLKLIAGPVGLDPQTLGDREGRRRVAEAIGRFRAHPALWGYAPTLAPSEANFADLARIADFVREHDPAHPLFVNLYPCDAWVGPVLPTADYVSYAERFVAAVRPALLSYACFPFREKEDGGFYYENLELIRRIALEHGLPFYPTLQGSSWSGMRPPGEGEVRWLAYTSLAYGAKGVVWFGYWGAPGGSRDGIVQPDGLETERYRWIAALNGELRVLGPVLLRLRSVGVWHTGPTPVGAARLPVHGLVGATEGGAFVVGEFAGAEGAHYVLIVNKDTHRDATAKLTINQPCRAVAWLEPVIGDWSEMATVADRFQTVTEFPLRPGGGRLIRLTLAR